MGCFVICRSTFVSCNAASSPPRRGVGDGMFVIRRSTFVFRNSASSLVRRVGAMDLLAYCRPCSGPRPGSDNPHTATGSQAHFLRRTASPRSTPAPQGLLMSSREIHLLAGPRAPSPGCFKSTRRISISWRGCAAGAKRGTERRSARKLDRRTRCNLLHLRTRAKTRLTARDSTTGTHPRPRIGRPNGSRTVSNRSPGRSNPLKTAHAPLSGFRVAFPFSRHRPRNPESRNRTTGRPL